MYWLTMHTRNVNVLYAQLHANAASVIT